MVDKVKSIWMDGQLVPWDDANVHVLTHSFHYGVAAFEGIRAYKRADGKTYIFRLTEHNNRLLDTCRLALMKPTYDVAAINQACIDVLRANSMEDGYLRPLIYMGEGAMGIYAPDNPVKTSVIAWKWGRYLGAAAIENGIRAKVSSFSRMHVNISLPKAKMTGQYTNSVLAKREAKLGGYDEAILLDVQGNVCEGTGENIFVIKNGVITTPDLSCSVLAGITRDTIIRLAKEEGYTVVEGRLSREQLWLADEVFFTGTAAEVTPVREVDDRPIGTGKRGPITQRLQERYFGIVSGADDSHPEWLTLVH